MSGKGDQAAAATEQKGKKDGDVGRASILLFGRELLNAVFVSRGGSDVKSNCEVRGQLSRKAFRIGGEGQLKKVTSEANKEITAGIFDEEAGPGVELHLRLITAMLGATHRENQHRN